MLVKFIRCGYNHSKSVGKPPVISQGLGITPCFVVIIVHHWVLADSPLEMRIKSLCKMLGDELQRSMVLKIR